MGILFDAESKTKRYQISILINATNQVQSKLSDILHRLQH